MSDYTELCDGDCNAAESWVEGEGTLPFRIHGQIFDKGRDAPFAGPEEPSATTVEPTMADNLSGSLHHLFDGVCDTTLPIYFGPLLGRLYLEGL